VVVGRVGLRASGVRGAEMGVRGVVRVVVVVVVAGKIGAKRRRWRDGGCAGLAALRGVVGWGWMWVDKLNGLGLTI
jgi:hypothetical protein